jgi:hypothetical protein
LVSLNWYGIMDVVVAVAAAAAATATGRTALFEP